MYNATTQHKTSIKVNKSYEGITLEEKIRRIVNNKEPLTDGAPLNYTERKDGVLPQYDIRSDRFEFAIEASTTINKTHLAKRQERIDLQWAKEHPEEAKAKAEAAAKEKEGKA